jgi:RNA-binding protein 5/10
VSEELLVKGVSKLNKPSSSTVQRDDTPAKKGAKVASTTGDANLGAKEGTLRRVLLVRDRRSNESWRYGFAEYAGCLGEIQFL